MSNNPAPREGLAIAVSGKSGCGNTTVSALLAHRLGLQLVNYTFRNLAADEGLDFEELRRLAETDDRWDRLVDERQVAKANAQPSVLASRLAIWVWPQAKLRVYLDAPLSVRARRIQQREQGPLDQKLESTRQRDERDHQRYLAIYGIDNDRWDHADLVIDVSVLSPDQIVDSIVEAL